MKSNFALTFLGVLAAMCGSAQAATYYVSDCQSGAASGCVAGNDSNTGTSTSSPWKSTTKVRAQFASLAAGDQILFARGGAWSNAAMEQMQNLNATASKPIVIDAYTASWGSTARPVLTETRAGTNLLSFDNGSTPVPDGGYIVRNLDLRGGGTAQWGIFTSGAVHDIIMSNLNIQGFDIGIHCGLSNERFQLLNSTLTDNGGQGILWGCNNSVIDGNTFDHNGYRSPDARDHSVYINNEMPSAANVVFRNNKLLNNSVPMSGGTCTAVPLVVHGFTNGLTIENNLIYQASGTSTPGCWGIAVDAAYSQAEGFSGVVIRGNTIVNVGGIGIGCAACVSPLIENNVVVMEGGPELVGIQIPDRQRGGDDSADTGAIIRNNSIYFKAPAKYAQGISFANQNGSTAGTKLQVTSNLIFFGSAPTGDHQCFDTSGVSLSNFTSFDYNLCFDTSGNGRYSTTYATLAAAKAAGFDAHGVAANPMFATTPSSSNNWSLALSAGSPAINAGSPLSSLKDRLSLVRTTPDIGAFEFGATGGDTVPPAAPTGVVVQ